MECQSIAKMSLSISSGFSDNSYSQVERGALRGKCFAEGNNATMQQCNDPARTRTQTSNHRSLSLSPWVKSSQ